MPNFAKSEVPFRKTSLEDILSVLSHNACRVIKFNKGLKLLIELTAAVLKNRKTLKSCGSKMTFRGNWRHLKQGSDRDKGSRRHFVQEGSSSELNPQGEGKQYQPRWVDDANGHPKHLVVKGKM